MQPLFTANIFTLCEKKRGRVKIKSTFIFIMKDFSVQ